MVRLLIRLISFLFQQRNIGVENEQLRKEFGDTVICPGCGRENSVRTVICPRCEYPLEGNQQATRPE
jgi:predicted amidophosphoribosyltransferase